MRFFSAAGKLWLYSGVTITKASAAARSGVTPARAAAAAAFGAPPQSGMASGRSMSARSMTSSSRPSWPPAVSRNQSATERPARPSRTLPMTTATRSALGCVFVVVTAVSTGTVWVAAMVWIPLQMRDDRLVRPPLR